MYLYVRKGESHFQAALRCVIELMRIMRTLFEIFMSFKEICRIGLFAYSDLDKKELR